MATNICLLGNLTTINGAICGTSSSWDGMHSWTTSASSFTTPSELTVANLSVKVITGTLAPDQGSGVAAPIGSIYLTTASGGAMFIKTNSSDTSWQQVCTQ